MNFSLCIRLPDSVPGFVIGIANRGAVPPLFQKLSPDIIIVGDIQRIIPCGDFGSDAAQSCLCACLRRAVSVAVIGIGGLHAVTVMDATDAVQSIVAITHFQSVIIKDAASSAQNVVLIPGADSRRVFDLRDLACPVMGIGN